MMYRLKKEWPISVIRSIAGDDDESTLTLGHTWIVGIELQHHELTKQKELIDQNRVEEEFGQALYSVYDESHLNVVMSETLDPIDIVTPELFAEYLFTAIRQQCVWGKYLTGVYIRQEPGLIISYSE
jgi:6-pyruvoyl-tetrahydropterin synthase